MEGTFVLSSKSKSAASAVCLQLTKLTGVCLHTDMENETKWHYRYHPPFRCLTSLERTEIPRIITNHHLET